jgi:hypothetical protein
MSNIIRKLKSPVDRSGSVLPVVLEHKEATSKRVKEIKQALRAKSANYVPKHRRSDEGLMVSAIAKDESTELAAQKLRAKLLIDAKILDVDGNFHKDYFSAETIARNKVHKGM